MTQAREKAPAHQRLSDALCEAVEFGRPTSIRIGHDGMSTLLDSLDAASFHKVDLSPTTFEGVALKVEPGFVGCVVEHDNRYVGLSGSWSVKAIPQTVVMMRDTRKPAIVAW